MNDRRHELQQNDLAIYLGRINQAIEPYSKAIAVVVGGLVVAAIGWVLYSSQQTGQRSDATLNLIEAMDGQDTEILEGVSEQYGDTLPGQWAKLYQANQYLADGVDALFADRDNAVALLGDAKVAYEESLEGVTDALLISRAHFGMARTHESMGELDEAILEYKQVIAAAESDAMIEKANNRIAALEKPATKDFLAWFADQDFSPADPSLPPSLPGSESLPDLPDLELPSLDLPGGDNSQVMESDAGLSLPADDETAATDEPANEKPANDEMALEEPATEAAVEAADVVQEVTAEASSIEKPATEEAGDK